MLVMSAKDICKSYGTDIILEDISFSINKGDRVGIVGPNGAGKTADQIGRASCRERV